MVFKSIGESCLDAVVNVRLTHQEKMRLKDDADLASLSMSELVRARYFGRKITSNSDMVMLNELRRIGGLLKHIHSQSSATDSQQDQTALIEVQNCIKNLSAQMDRK